MKKVTPISQQDQTMISTYFNEVLVPAQWPEFGWPPKGEDLDETQMQTIANMLDFQLWTVSTSAKDLGKMIYKQSVKRIMDLVRRTSGVKPEPRQMKPFPKSSFIISGNRTIDEENERMIHEICVILDERPAIVKSMIENSELCAEHLLRYLSKYGTWPTAVTQAEISSGYNQIRQLRRVSPAAAAQAERLLWNPETIKKQPVAVVCTSIQQFQEYETKQILCGSNDKFHMVLKSHDAHGIYFSRVELLPQSIHMGHSAGHRYNEALEAAKSRVLPKNANK